MFDTLLVCNRGEIAVRIVRTCRKLGIRSVVAHSTADRDSLAVSLADEAFCLGPPPSGRSYLNIPAVLYACARTGAQAVHPGYGFLAEDPTFATICEDVGLTFVGPPPKVIAMMGDKSAARAAMIDAGLPVAAGSVHPLTGADDAAEQAAEIGYPVVLKAVAGGGGRGIAVVRRLDDLTAAFEEVRSAARTLFLDDRVGIERYVERARHVEVQLLGDGTGHIVQLGDRDCTVQRRHQKLLEESPSTALDPDLADRIHAAAVHGARSIGFRNAGTVEFLVDEQGDFYFMEMNPRIQVEHPVTEMRTGIDLVEAMILVAAGENLWFTQAEVIPRGHVIECRINAEDVSADWGGRTGRITRFQPPAGPDVRFDSHVYSGYTLPPHYDSLLAKLIVRGADRPDAIRRMRRALAELECEGVPTTRDFHLALLSHPVFVAGTHRSDFLDRYLEPDGVLRAE